MNHPIFGLIVLIINDEDFRMIDTPDLKDRQTIIDMPKPEGVITEVELFCLHHGKQTIKTNIPL